MIFAQVSRAESSRVMTGAPGPQVRGRMGRTSLQIVTPGGYGAHSQAPAGLRDLNSRFVQR